MRGDGGGVRPYSPLGRGFLTGKLETRESLPEGDWRLSGPRFQAEAMAANQAIVDVVKAVAAERGATPAQVALAWVLAKGEHVAPIPGTKRVTYLEENMAAQDVELAPDDLARLDAVRPPEGERYPETSMAYVAR